MSSKFVRNITNTKIKGDNKEPLHTNVQNDLLSDGEDVAVRNGKDYHILTDNIKNLIAGNEFIRIERVDKNTIKIFGSDVDLSEYAKIDYVDKKFDEIEIDLSDYVTNDNFTSTIDDILESLSTFATIEYVNEQIQNIDIDLSDYYTKDEVNNLVDDLENMFDGYYTKSEINTTYEIKRLYDTTNLFAVNTSGVLRVNKQPFKTSSLPHDSTIFNENDKIIGSSSIGVMFNENYSMIYNDRTIFFRHLSTKTTSQPWFELNFTGEGKQATITDKEIIDKFDNLVAFSNSNDVFIVLKMINISNNEIIYGTCLVDTVSPSELTFNFNVDISEIVGKFVLI